MPNVYEVFKALIPDDVQLIAKIVEVGPVYSQVQHLGGAQVGGDFGYNGVLEQVQGTGTLGALVFVKGGLIIGPAPNLPVVEVVLFGV